MLEYSEDINHEKKSPEYFSIFRALTQYELSILAIIFTYHQNYKLRYIYASTINEYV